MPEKKNATEKPVEETERSSIDRKTLIGAGAFLAAIALFAGGYAIGNSSDDALVASDGSIVRDEVRSDDDAVPDADLSEDLPLPRGDRFGLGMECTPEGECTFHLPDGFEFEPFPRGPLGDDWQRGDRFPHRPGNRFEFDLPEDFPLPGGGFGFGLECDDAGNCTFQVPEGFPDDFEYPAPYDDDTPDVEQRGYLGVAVVDEGGALVAEVSPGSPAADAGIEPGDLIIAVGDREIGGVADLTDAIGDAGAGSEVVVTVLRDGDQVSFEAVLTARPS